MDEEISAMARRIAEGVEVTPDTVAGDVIKSIGPRGDYLTADHTLDRLHGKEYLPPRVSVRGPRATWEAGGAKDTYQLARDLVRDRYRHSPGCPLSADRRAKLTEIITGFQG